MPGLERIGPKHFELARKWIPSAALYGITGVLGICYITDFRTVLQYVPVWNRKYRDWPPLNPEE